MQDLRLMLQPHNVKITYFYIKFKIEKKKKKHKNKAITYTTCTPFGFVFVCYKNKITNTWCLYKLILVFIHRWSLIDTISWVMTHPIPSSSTHPSPSPSPRVSSMCESQTHKQHFFDQFHAILGSFDGGWSVSYPWPWPTMVGAFGGFWWLWAKESGAEDRGGRGWPIFWELNW